MQHITNQSFGGERPLFAIHDTRLENVTITEGESGIKCCHDIEVDHCRFIGKYPLWHVERSLITNSHFEVGSRSAIWYSNDMVMRDCVIDAPKFFREMRGLDIENVELRDADETFWRVSGLRVRNVTLHDGTYPFMFCSDIDVDGLRSDSKYVFQYVRNAVIRRAHIVTKDAFWETENVTIYDSHLDGEYLGWHSRNLRLVRCHIAGEQPLCYIDGLTLEDCSFDPASDRAFEDSRDIRASIRGHITEIKNPISGHITADSIGRITIDEHIKQPACCDIKRDPPPALPQREGVVTSSQPLPSLKGGFGGGSPFDTLILRRGTDCVKWDKAAEGELPLWVADMDFATAPCIIEALRQRLEHPVFGYNLIPESFYDAIIRWNTRRHGWTPQREHILYTSGVVPALSAIIRGLVKPGEAVLFMTPAYNCFFSSVSNNGCREVHFPITWQPEAERYAIDFEAFEATIRRERPRLFVLCNPHNPTGRVWTAEELHTMAAICARHGVIVLSDEIHCEFIDPQLGRRYLPFAPIADEANCQWVVANAPNKAFNIAGLMTAYIVCPDDHLRQAIERAININEVCDINCFAFVALQAAYTDEGGEWLDQLVTYIFDGYRHFRSRMKSALPHLPLAHLEGTYLAWLDVSSLGDSRDISDRLRRDNLVWVNPGDMYGQPGFLRINLATQRSRLDEATTRIINGLTKIIEQ